MKPEDFLTGLGRREKKISVIGLGYVGLPLALAFAKKFSVIGFDINEERVEMMRRNVDPSAELSEEDFQDTDILFTSHPADLQQAHFHIVAVPTPVDEHKVPDLKPVFSASKTVASILKPGDFVVYESTVYPGCTEEDCLPILEQGSGLKLGADFKIGYSPERINPGDKEHTITKILKIVSGNDAEALEVVAGVYSAIIEAGIFRAGSIKVAEAAKVIENTQRDLNISFMNELSIIFDRMGIDTREVLEAAGTKWNFLKFYPGLVGGHCIGVDPYYLVHKSLELGYNPQVILSGRRINDGMPAFVAQRLVQILIQQGKNPGACKVLVMGITFKEDVADIRNSKVADLVRELMKFSVSVHITDPHASPNEVAHEYGLSLVDQPSGDYDAVLVAVGHKDYLSHDIRWFKSVMNDKPVLVDLKGLYRKPEPEEGLVYWRL
ncbi:MAG: nucleotide sugar dehydrogenase [Saprospiraceae bacterium]|nr:nucleotide sugar dehydrogenase [Saprospiraceae bacterium]HRK82256.1 nucleotide sugar dehydrogenase [Saprospiraceae bacterium]